MDLMYTPFKNKCPICGRWGEPGDTCDCDPVRCPKCGDWTTHETREEFAGLCESCYWKENDEPEEEE